MIHDNDVVVTGIGTVSPYGYGTELFWEGMRNGRDTIGKISKIDVEQNYAQKGGEITWYNPHDFFSDKELRRWDVNTQYGILALEEAKKDAGIVEFPESTGIFMGTLTAGLPFAEIYYENLLKDIYKPRYITQCFRASLADNLAKKNNIIGPKITVTTACSASAHSIGIGASYIKRNKVKMAIVGGADAFCKITWSGFSALRALSASSVAPFSADRSGTQIGEGGGILILESYKSAQLRNAKIYGIIKGWGASSDAYHITAPNPSGETEAVAMMNAIQKANIVPNMIDVIGTHGTGTELNDKMETLAIKKVFGKEYKKPLVTSIKSLIGHTMGAAGVHLSIGMLGMMKSQEVYPTINYKYEDKDCDLSIVTNNSRKQKIEYAMINAFGFGGNNASLILENIR